MFDVEKRGNRSGVGRLRNRSALAGRLTDAILFDRDGTLIRDVPYNGDPAAVTAMPGARAALDRLRAAGLRVGVITNQSGVARGLLTTEQVDAVNRRVEELLGPFDTWQVCPHDERAGCGCRKPAPGMIEAAARALGTEPARCVVVGDIGADMRAAAAAGALGVLVPTPVTRLDEVAAAPVQVRNLAVAADWILARQMPVADRRPGGHVLAVRTDSAGDVLLTGPALRALACGADRLTLLCGPRGEAAAQLLPGVDDLITWHTPWIDPEPKPVDPVKVNLLVDRIAALAVDEAVVFTSFHQSPLPFALLLRLAGVLRISAISTDYPGSLLDLRHRVDESLPEPERALSLAAAAGFGLPAEDDGRLRIKPPEPMGRAPGYVVVHPGASVPARACPPELLRELVLALVAAGYRVVVTGSPQERELTRLVAGAEAVDLAGWHSGRTGQVVDLGGRTGLAQLAGVLADAACVVCANTGPAHLAAAMGTPVVSLFAPTVPYGRWAPYRVPHVRLGDPLADCRDSRAATCPVPGHPCLASISPADAVAAVDLLVGAAVR
jgi:HAD superfamily hydrolase (TIGR01662 family)